MSGFLDYITLNRWVIVLAVVTFSVGGYVLTRPIAVRGRGSGDDSSAWVAFCMGMYPDTRRSDDEDASSADDMDTSDMGGADD